MDDFVKCERYANSVKIWFEAQGPYPGDPPVGYDIHCRNNPRTMAPPTLPNPLPSSHYAPYQYPAHMNQYPPMPYQYTVERPELAMSSEVFNAFIKSQHNLVSLILAKDQPRDSSRYHLVEAPRTCHFGGQNFRFHHGAQGGSHGFRSSRGRGHHLVNWVSPRNRCCEPRHADGEDDGNNNSEIKRVEQYLETTLTNLFPGIDAPVDGTDEVEGDYAEQLVAGPSNANEEMVIDEIVATG